MGLDVFVICDNKFLRSSLAFLNFNLQQLLKVNDVLFLTNKVITYSNQVQCYFSKNGKLLPLIG